MSKNSSTLSQLLKPTPCAFLWNGTPLTESYLSHHSKYDLKDVPLEETVAKLSQEESFVKQVEISNQTALTFGDRFQQDLFFTNLNYGNLDFISTVSSFLPVLPDSFILWIKNKKLNPKDFRAFLHDFDKERDSSAFVHFSNLNPSKGQGLNLIEIYFDLIASNKLSPSFVLDFKSPEKLFLALKKKRFAKTLNSDDDVSTKLSKLELTKGARLSLNRQGDQRLLKLEVNSSSPQQLDSDLKKIALKIQEIQSAWEIQ